MKNLWERLSNNNRDKLDSIKINQESTYLWLTAVLNNNNSVLDLKFDEGIAIWSIIGKGIGTFDFYEFCKLFE